MDDWLHTKGHDLPAQGLGLQGWVPACVVRDGQRAYQAVSSGFPGELQDFVQGSSTRRPGRDDLEGRNEFVGGGDDTDWWNFDVFSKGEGLFQSLL
jgi:hypothetical protein